MRKYCVINLLVSVIYVQSNDSQTTNIPGLDIPIAEGQSINIREAPYICLVEYQRNVVCGCAIINNRFVLSTALCILIVPGKKLRSPELLNITQRIQNVDNNKSMYNIRVGISSTLEIGSIHSIHGINFHEDFEFFQIISSDICVLEVYPPIKYSFVVQRIAMSGGAIPVGTEVNVSTFLPTIPDNYKALELHRDTMWISRFEDCKNLFGNYTLQLILDDTFVCGHRALTDSEPCHQDTGGPMVIKNTTLLAGLTSLDFSCDGLPVAFTRISKFRKWIKITMLGLNNLRKLNEIRRRKKKKTN